MQGQYEHLSLSDGNCPADRAPVQPPTSAPQAVDQQTAQPPVAYAVPVPAEGPISTDQEWACPRCSLNNQAGVGSCAACGYSPDGFTAAPVAGVPFTNLWQPYAGVAVGVPTTPPVIVQVDEVELELARVKMYRASFGLLLVIFLCLLVFPFTSLIALCGGGMAVYWTRDPVAFRTGGDIRGCCNRDTALTVHFASCCAASFIQALVLIGMIVTLAEPDTRQSWGVAAVLLVCGIVYLAVLLFNASLASRLRVLLRPRMPTIVQATPVHQP
eukprot:TRINITY_DN61696_c0_g1_i1.p1 TRINITY_DN61696_c0_g1~~TRINITY_DN61696_c0_g1_i1.p1  ORF type:complete len:271 (+),score=50.43 TRINITY_DN61696_c0_g1_i1:85-897(+)